MQTSLQRTLSWVVTLALTAAAGCSDQVTAPTKQLQPDDEIRAGKAIFPSVSVLEPLPGGVAPYSAASAINDLGQVVGQSSTATGYFAVVWDNSSIPENLGAPAGHTSSFAGGISNDGRVIAGTSTSGSTNYAVRWLRSNGQWLIDVLPYSAGCIVSGVSSDGTAIVATCDGTTAVVWLNGSRINLGSGYANGVNSKGQAVGSNTAFNHALLWTFLPGPVTETDLGNLGGTFAVAQKINDAGEVTGWSENASSVSHAFLWSPRRGMVDLAPGTVTSGGYGINATGKVVGDMFPGGSTQHAGYYDGRKVIDLGVLPGYTGAVAGALNNLGQIVGTSYNSLQYRATKWVLK